MINCTSERLEYLRIRAESGRIGQIFLFYFLEEMKAIKVIYLRFFDIYL